MGIRADRRSKPSPNELKQKGTGSPIGRSAKIKPAVASVQLFYSWWDGLGWIGSAVCFWPGHKLHIPDLVPGFAFGISQPVEGVAVWLVLGDDQDRCTWPADPPPVLAAAPLGHLTVRHQNDTDLLAAPEPDHL